MTHRKCTICGQDIVLVPSAKHRAQKSGGTPEDYLNLFTAHAKCQIDKRARETGELIERQYPWGYRSEDKEP